MLHVGKNNQDSNYYMKVKDSVEQIKILNEEKDLGVIFDNTLSFDTHIGKIVNKANQMLRIIRRSFSYLYYSKKETHSYYFYVPVQVCL